MKKYGLITLSLILILVVLSGCVGERRDLLSEGRNIELVGEWRFEGAVFYRFYEDGTGYMLNIPLRWSSYDGRLYICQTIRLCARGCTAPTIWRYTLEDNILRIRGFGGVTFEYIR